MRPSLLELIRADAGGQTIVDSDPGSPTRAGSPGVAIGADGNVYVTWEPRGTLELAGP